MKKSISEYEEAYAKTHLEFWEEEIKKYKDILYPEKKSFFNFFKKK